jgi:hypothetical protein
MTDTLETNDDIKPAADSLLADAPAPLTFESGKPEGFPDDFWDADKNAPDVNKLFDTYQQTHKRMEGLRQKLSKGEFEGKAPADIKEYVLELSDDLKQYVPDDDRLIAKAREAAKEAGLPKEAFNKMMIPLIQEVVAMQQDAVKPPSPEEVSAAKEAEFAKLGANGKVVAQAVNGFINTMVAEGKLTKDEAVAAQNMVYNAETLKVMNKFRSMINPSTVPIGIPVTQDSSRSEIEANMAKAFNKGDEAEYTKFKNMLMALG